MNKRKCCNCKLFFDVDDMSFVGVSFFCSVECVIEKRNKRAKQQGKIHSSTSKKHRLDPALRRRIIKRDYHRCRVCREAKYLHVHHVRYLSQGGEDSVDNLVTLCQSCHSLVHSDKGLYQPALIALLDKINVDNGLLQSMWDFIDD